MHNNKPLPHLEPHLLPYYFATLKLMAKADGEILPDENAFLNNIKNAMTQQAKADCDRFYNDLQENEDPAKKLLAKIPNNTKLLFYILNDIKTMARNDNDFSQPAIKFYKMVLEKTVSAIKDASLNDAEDINNGTAYQLQGRHLICEIFEDDLEKEIFAYVKKNNCNLSALSKNYPNLYARCMAYSALVNYSGDTANFWGSLYEALGQMQP